MVTKSYETNVNRASIFILFIGSLIILSLASKCVKKRKQKHLRVIEMTIICQTSKVDR